MLSLLVPWWSRRKIEWGQIAPLTHFRTAYIMSLVFVCRISITTQRQYTSGSLAPHTKYTASIFTPFVKIQSENCLSQDGIKKSSGKLKFSQLCDSFLLALIFGTIELLHDFILLLRRLCKHSADALS